MRKSTDPESRFMAAGGRARGRDIERDGEGYRVMTGSRTDCIHSFTLNMPPTIESYSLNS